MEMVASNVRLSPASGLAPRLVYLRGVVLQFGNMNSRQCNGVGLGIRKDVMFSVFFFISLFDIQLDQLNFMWKFYRSNGCGSFR